jgi:hypothetical protein
MRTDEEPYSLSIFITRTERREHLGDTIVDWRIILKQIWKKCCGVRELNSRDSK